MALGLFLISGPNRFFSREAHAGEYIRKEARRGNTFLKSLFFGSLSTVHFRYTTSEMQFKNIVASFAAVAAVQAANVSNGTNGTNATNGSNGTTTKVSTGAAATNAMGAGVFGAAVAAGVAFLF
ncbi:hypothetical protein ACU8KH_03483 [Lachancea thermotolerans]